MQELRHQVLIKRRYQICVHGSCFLATSVDDLDGFSEVKKLLNWRRRQSTTTFTKEGVYPRPMSTQSCCLSPLDSGMQQGVDLNNLDCWPAPDSPSDRFLLVLMVKLILKQEIHCGAIWFPAAHCIIIRLLQRLVFLLIQGVSHFQYKKRKTQARSGFASTHQSELATNSSGSTIQLGALYDQAI